jgi:Helix-turn-helix domain
VPLLFLAGTNMTPSELLAVQELFNTEETASILNMAPETLREWRVTGGGPRFVHKGRYIRYRKRDLETWLNLNTCDTTRDYVA